LQVLLPNILGKLNKESQHAKMTCISFGPRFARLQTGYTRWTQRSCVLYSARQFGLSTDESSFESLSKCKYTYQIDAKFGAQVCLWSDLYRDWRSLKNTREIAAEKNDRVDLFCFFAARYKNEFRGSRRLVSPVAKPQIFGEHCNTVCTKFFCCFHTSKKCSLRIWMMPLCHPWATPQNAN